MLQILIKKRQQARKYSWKLTQSKLPVPIAPTTTKNERKPSPQQPLKQNGARSIKGDSVSVVRVNQSFRRSAVGELVTIPAIQQLLVILEGAIGS
ncbi:hypothetical protein QUA54_29710 [Microcoleus sp. MOSTC5]|uniref:hypothetical protein n=1 Tax=Microcoleus sp. MOSTC5 TaxID=3055378 RepID=UPI002FCF3490